MDPAAPLTVGPGAVDWAGVRDGVDRMAQGRGERAGRDPRKALLDVTVGRTPRHDGPPIDLGGDGRVTAG